MKTDPVAPITPQGNNYVEEFFNSIDGLTTEQQIDMAMYYCQSSSYWREFIGHPLTEAWIKANADALHRRAKLT